MPRDYESPAREQKKVQTRVRILEACAAVILDDGFGSFSVQSVADRAGVSHRTVYRYFPTRDELTEALYDHLEAEMAARGGRSMAEIRDVPGLAAEAFDLFAEFPDMTRAVVRIQAGAGMQTRGKSARDRAFQQGIDAEWPHVPEGERRKLFGAMRSLAGSQTYVLMTDQLGLTPDEAAASVSSTLQLLIDRLDALSGGRDDGDPQAQT